MSSREIPVHYKDFIEFAKFTDAWAQSISKVDFVSLFDSPAMIEAIGEFVGEEIDQAVGGDPFGKFMIERTYVEVFSTGAGVSIRIGGYSEQEVMEMGGNHRLSDSAFEDKLDYNLWEMYEFHGGAIGTKGMPKGKNGKQVIQKDVAGPLVVRTSTGGTQQLRGRKGLISAVIPQIKSQLNAKLLDLMQSVAGLALTGSAEKAANEARALKGLSSAMQKKARQKASDVDIDLAKMGADGLSVHIGKNGKIMVRGGGGQFVNSPLNGQKIRAKRG